MAKNNRQYLPGEAFIEIDDYDEGIRQLVPYYDLMQEVIANVLPEKTRTILELGSGTGELTLKLLKTCSQSRLLCIDYSERMIRCMKNKIRPGGLHSRVDWISSDIKNVHLIENEFLKKGSLDACVSSLVLHHLDDDNKQKLIRHIYDLLKPGGHLWIADTFLPESVEMAFYHNLAREKWLTKNHLTREMLSSKMVQDKYYSKDDTHNHTTLKKLMEMFHQAGFRNTELLWKYFGLAVLGGIKQ